MAGHYSLDKCRIDLRPLLQKANVRLHLDHAVGVDAAQRRVSLSDGTQLDYDLLSLDLGSQTETSLLQAAGERLLPVKPLDEFVTRWPRIVQAAARQTGYQLVVVGGGAAGVELAFAARYAFEQAGLSLNPFCFRAVVLPVSKQKSAEDALVLIPFVSGLWCFRVNANESAHHRRS